MYIKSFDSKRFFKTIKFEIINFILGADVDSMTLDQYWSNSVYAIQLV